MIENVIDKVILDTTFVDYEVKFSLKRFLCSIVIILLTLAAIIGSFLYYSINLDNQFQISNEVVSNDCIPFTKKSVSNFNNVNDALTLIKPFIVTDMNVNNFILDAFEIKNLNTTFNNKCLDFLIGDYKIINKTIGGVIYLELVLEMNKISFEGRLFDVSSPTTFNINPLVKILYNQYSQIIMTKCLATLEDFQPFQCKMTVRKPWIEIITLAISSGTSVFAITTLIVKLIYKNIGNPFKLTERRAYKDHAKLIKVNDHVKHIESYLNNRGDYQSFELIEIDIDS